MMNKLIYRSLVITFVGFSLAACSSKPFFDTMAKTPSELFTTQYGSGGTKLPENPEYHFLTGVSVSKDVTDKFGPPQIIESKGMKTVMTYRYWKNALGEPTYEENYLFTFNNNGFFEGVVKSVDLNGIHQTESKTEREEECPSRFTLCGLYKQ